MAANKIPNGEWPPSSETNIPSQPKPVVPENDSVYLNSWLIICPAPANPEIAPLNSINTMICLLTLRPVDSAKRGFFPIDLILYPKVVLFIKIQITINTANEMKKKTVNLVEPILENIAES